MSDKELQWDIAQALPPETMSEPLQALWWLAKGDWQLGAEWDRAHEICQRHEGSMEYDWVHALAHWIEGDSFNSGYWYRRSGQTRTSDNAREEWQHIVSILT